MASSYMTLNERDSVPAGAVPSETRFSIIDDVPVNARLVQAHLEDAGYVHFQVLTDATRAVAAVRDESSGHPAPRLDDAGSQWLGDSGFHSQ